MPKNRAIEVLERDHATLSHWLETKGKGPKPFDWRESEWAMHVANITLQKQQVSEALHTLKSAEGN